MFRIGKVIAIDHIAGRGEIMDNYGQGIIFILKENSDYIKQGDSVQFEIQMKDKGLVAFQIHSI